MDFKLATTLKSYAPLEQSWDAQSNLEYNT